MMTMLMINWFNGHVAFRSQNSRKFTNTISQKQFSFELRKEKSVMNDDLIICPLNDGKECDKIYTIYNADDD